MQVVNALRAKTLLLLLLCTALTAAVLLLTTSQSSAYVSTPPVQDENCEGDCGGEGDGGDDGSGDDSGSGRDSDTPSGSSGGGSGSSSGGSGSSGSGSSSGSSYGGGSTTYTTGGGTPTGSSPSPSSTVTKASTPTVTEGGEKKSEDTDPTKTTSDEPNSFKVTPEEASRVCVGLEKGLNNTKRVESTTFPGSDLEKNANELIGEYNEMRSRLQCGSDNNAPAPSDGTLKETCSDLSVARSRLDELWPGWLFPDLKSTASDGITNMEADLSCGAVRAKLGS